MSKILIIEDDPDTARVVAKRLEQEGLSVIVALDAYEGTKMAHSQKPDLIILDLMLPAGGGLFVLGNIRMSAETRSLPIIVLTGVKAEDTKEKAQKLGVEAYLEKPYEPAVLVSTVKNILEGKVS